MGGFRGKCKVCKTSVTKNNIEDGKGIVINYKGSNMYFCCQEHCKKHMEELKASEKWYKDRDDIDKFVKENILLYKPEQQLPKYFFDRLSDLGNGTIRGKDGSELVNKNLRKEGYPLEVILQAFKDSRDTILYWFRNKSFNNERQKLNYMWRIIEGCINDEYDKWLRTQQLNSQKIAVVEQEQVDSIYNKEFEIIKPKNVTDLSWALED